MDRLDVFEDYMGCSSGPVLPEASVEPAEKSSDWHIEAIHAAACRYFYAGDSRTTLRHAEVNLSEAIDAAMSHAYAEGRADERQDWIEKAMRAMNEFDQDEHGVTK